MAFCCSEGGDSINIWITAGTSSTDGLRAVSYCEVRVGEEPIDKPGFSMVFAMNIVWRFEMCKYVQGVVKIRMYDEGRLEEENIKKCLSKFHGR